jgi:ABC-type glycerol-3-phosphate transport system permease component
LNTRIGLLLCYISNELAFGIFLLKRFFDELAKEIEEAARIDGCSRFGMYWRIALPLVKPALTVPVIIINSTAICNGYKIKQKCLYKEV